MTVKVNIYYIIPFLLSAITLIIFWAFFHLFSEDAFFYVNLPFAFMVFVFSYLLLNWRSEDIPNFSKLTNRKVPEIICIITVLSVLAVLFIPSYNGSILNWELIPLMNWVKYIASILLTLFLPGYLIIKIFDSNDSLDFLATISFSFILSMFISFIAGFCLLLTYNSITLLALFWLVAVNLGLMAIYYVTHSLNRRRVNSIDFNLAEIFAVVSVLLMVISGSIYVMSKTIPLSGGDMWGHLAQALQYQKGFPVYDGTLIPSYPYLFQVFLSTFFQLTGLPAAISYQALFALSFIGVLTFYVFIKKWLPERKMYSIAILMSPLLGFGSLYVLSLKAQNPSDRKSVV